VIGVSDILGVSGVPTPPRKKGGCDSSSTGKTR
jgi:hypothetical protein